jgi:regulator of sirC expression with transglutaminase-like and TPR domain
MWTCVLAGVVCAAAGAAVWRGRAVEEVPYLERLLAMKEDDIDVAAVVLNVKKLSHPELDVNKYLRQIDALADDVKTKTMGETDTEIILMVMHTVLRDHGFAANGEAAPVKRGEWGEWGDLDVLLETKKGSCYSLPVLELGIAQRLGYPIYPVKVPGHFFLRYIDAGLNVRNIEPTNGNVFFTDETYAKECGLPSAGAENGFYLRTLSYREYVGEILLQQGVRWAEEDDYARARPYFEAARMFTPTDPEIHSALGAADTYLSMAAASGEALNHLNGMGRNQSVAAARGYVDPRETPIGERVLGRER